MTKMTTVAPNGSCPKWVRFLEQVTGGDKTLQAYLKRVCGYMVTGCVREHAMFFLYGLGGKGKGTFLKHVGLILGPYRVESPAETFAEKKGEGHATESARLDGARCVVSQETEQGQYWAEARIKALTGGDIISARFIRGDYFEFPPRFKQCIAGNHTSCAASRPPRTCRSATDQSYLSVTAIVDDRIRLHRPAGRFSSFASDPHRAKRTAPEPARCIGSVCTDGNNLPKFSRIQANRCLSFQHAQSTTH